MEKLALNEGPLQGVVNVPGDKSVSHRAVMLASLALGKSRIGNFLAGEDCLHTIEVFRAMGATIERTGTDVIISGNGIDRLQEPTTPLYFGNSGTTARLMLGILAGLPFFTTVYGDPSLSKRPMERVVTPLKKMGALIDGRQETGFLPLAIRGTKLRGITYELPVKSAQVKSALLFAGLFADSKTTVIEKAATRNHTENMLQATGVPVEVNGNTISVSPLNGQALSPLDIHVPGDISSAAFILTGAAITPGSNVFLKNVGLNPTRTGILDVLQQMGADIKISNEHLSGGELIGDIEITHSDLKGVDIEGDIIPRLIDEIPAIALLATQADGTTHIRDAAELRVKETDRIAAIVDALTVLGADVEATDDGMIIHGKTELKGGKTKSYKDHRIAMMIAMASIIAKGEIWIDDTACIAISYPGFFSDLQKLLSNSSKDSH